MDLLVAVSFKVWLQDSTSGGSTDKLLACRLKRAGLDYWPFVTVKYEAHMPTLRNVTVLCV
jgi:hypothetical protein